MTERSETPGEAGVDLPAEDITEFAVILLRAVDPDATWETATEERKDRMMQVAASILDRAKALGWRTE